LCIQANGFACFYKHGVQSYIVTDASIATPSSNVILVPLKRNGELNTELEGGEGRNRPMICEALDEFRR
jgi:hypothetical protein